MSRICLVVLVSILSFTSCIADDVKTARKISLAKNFPNELSGDVSVFKTFTYRVDTLVVGFNHETTRIEFSVSIDAKAPMQYPVFVYLTQRHGSMLIHLPYFVGDGSTTTVNYTSASRTLCIPEHNLDDPERHVFVRVSSGSIQSISFKIKFLVKDNLQAIINEPSNLTLTPTTRSHLFFPFKSKISQNVIVKVRSNNDECMALSIQEPMCPSFESETETFVRGWKIMSRSGASRVDMRDYPKGFYIKVFHFGDDSMCGNLKPISPERRQKKVEITIEDDLGLSFSNGHFIIVFATPPVLSLLISVLCGGIYTTCYLTRRKNMVVCRAQNLSKGMSLKKLSNIELQKSSHYGKWTIIVSLLFAIPMIDQTVYNSMTSNKVGMYGTCNPDSLCSHPFWIFGDLNHVWSNISYILLGFFFILFTLLKKTIRETGDEDEGVKFYSGLYYAMGLSLVFQGVINSSYHFCPTKSNFQYELMYMSGIFAICLLKMLELRRPMTFKVESSCAILVLFFVISDLGVVFERYLWDFQDIFFAFRLTIAVIHGIFLFYASIYVIYTGYPIRRSFEEPENEQIPLQTVLTELRERNQETFRTTNVATTFSPKNANEEEIMKYFGEIPRFLWIFPKVWDWKIPHCRPERLIHVLFMLSLNGFLIYHSLSINYCLYVFLFLTSNFALNIFIYFMMKCILGEFACKCKSLYVFVFAIFALLFGAGSVYFFLENLGEWAEPATHARVGDEECLWYLPFKFYSKHDAWHILSAHTLFFIFMVLLSLDDGVDGVNREYLLLF